MTVHFVSDGKHCGKLKARVVAVGHLTKKPMKLSIQEFALSGTSDSQCSLLN